MAWAAYRRLYEIVGRTAPSQYTGTAYADYLDAIDNKQPIRDPLILFIESEGVSFKNSDGTYINTLQNGDITAEIILSNDEENTRTLTAIMALKSRGESDAWELERCQIEKLSVLNGKNTYPVTMENINMKSGEYQLSLMVWKSDITPVCKSVVLSATDEIYENFLNASNNDTRYDLMSP